MTRRSRVGRSPVAVVAIAAVTMVIGACSSGSSRSATADSPSPNGSRSATPANVAAAKPAAAVLASVPPGTTLRVADQLQALEEELAAAGQNTAFPYTVAYS